MYLRSFIVHSHICSVRESYLSNKWNEVMLTQ